jgi:hypothetical protein
MQGDIQRGRSLSFKKGALVMEHAQLCSGGLRDRASKRSSSRTTATHDNTATFNAVFVLLDS